MSIRIQLLDSCHLHILTNVVPGVFDRAVDPDLAAEYLNNSHNHIAAAIDDQLIVGMASAIDYIHPDKPRQLWINEVGVAPDYQGKGIGKQLINSLLDLAREIGCYEAWVGTDPGNTHARRLYETTGGKDESVIMYTYDLSNDQ